MSRQYVTAASDAFTLWEEVKRLREMCRYHEAAGAVAETENQVAQSNAKYHERLYNMYAGKVMPLLDDYFYGNTADKTAAKLKLKALCDQYKYDND